MTESPVPTDSLERDLRSYFVATTAVAVPRGVAAMNSRTIIPARRSFPRLLAGAAATVALAAAVLVLLVIRLGSHPSTTGSDLALKGVAGGAGSSALHPAPPPAGVSVSYPGVGTAALAAQGVQLSLPGGQVTTPVGAARAQGLAIAARGDGRGTPGPAVLVQAALTRPRPRSCLCWAVAVTPPRASAAAQPHVTDLVLIDAVSGGLVATLQVVSVP